MLKNALILLLNMHLNTKISAKTHIILIFSILIISSILFFSLMYFSIFIRKILAIYLEFKVKPSIFIYPSLYLYFYIFISFFLTLTSIYRINAIISNLFIRIIIILSFILISIFTNFILTSIILMIILAFFKKDNESKALATSSFSYLISLNFNAKIKPKFFNYFSIYLILSILSYFVVLNETVLFINAIIVTNCIVVFTPFLYCEIFYILNDFSRYFKILARFIFFISVLTYYISFITIDKKSLFYDYIQLISVISFLYLYFICFINVCIKLISRSYKNKALHWC